MKRNTLRKKHQTCRKQPLYLVWTISLRVLQRILQYILQFLHNGFLFLYLKSDIVKKCIFLQLHHTRESRNSFFRLKITKYFKKYVIFLKISQISNHIFHFLVLKSSFFLVHIPQPRVPCLECLHETIFSTNNIHIAQLQKIFIFRKTEKWHFYHIFILSIVLKHQKQIFGILRKYR